MRSGDICNNDRFVSADIGLPIREGGKIEKERMTSSYRLISTADIHTFTIPETNLVHRDSGFSCCTSLDV